MREMHMLTRRSLLASAGAGVVAAHVAPARAAAKLGEDGLYHLDWYLESFLDLAEDLTAASAKGKRFAIMWGLKGCPACKRMHLVHFADPKIEAYIRDNFEILHLNHIGARIVTDFDGRKLGEKALAASYGIQFTPSIQFFPEDAASVGRATGKTREVARMPGLLDPPEFLGMFRYVREKAYETTPFADWIKKQA
jgi:thioredoxin-related protein